MRIAPTPKSGKMGGGSRTLAWGRPLGEEELEHRSSRSEIPGGEGGNPEGVGWSSRCPGGHPLWVMLLSGQGADGLSPGIQQPHGADTCRGAESPTP